jgi:hypothetical protein
VLHLLHGGHKKLADASIGWIEVIPTSGSNAHVPFCCLWCRMAPPRDRRTLAADLAPSRVASPTHSPSTLSTEYTLTPWSSPALSLDHAASTPSKNIPSHATSPKSTPSTPSSYAASAEQTRTPWNSPASSPEYVSTPSGRAESPEYTNTPWNSPVSPDHTSSISSHAASSEFAPRTPPIRSAASLDYRSPAPCNSPRHRRSTLRHRAAPHHRSTRRHHGTAPCRQTTPRRLPAAARRQSSPPGSCRSAPPPRRTTGHRRPGTAPRRRSMPARPS